MSSLRLNTVTIRTAALAAVGVAALAGLSACEERPYSVPVRTAAYAPPKSHDLAGAPVAPPSYAPPAPTYVAPPAPAYVAPAPTYAEALPAYAPPASPVQTYRPAPSYDTGGPMIVAMAPIPNPEGRYGKHSRATYGEAAPAPKHYAMAKPAPKPRYAPEPEQYGSAPYGSYGSGAVVGMAPVPNPSGYRKPVHAYAAKPVMPKPAYMPAPKAPTYAAAKPAPMPMPKPMPKAPTYAAATPPKAPPVKTTVTTVEKKIVASTKMAAADTKVAAADAANSAKLAAVKTADAAKVAAAAATAKTAQVAAKVADATKAPKPGVATMATPAPTGGDRTTKLAALQATLTDAVSKTGVLTTPARFTANQPADVSLTLPAAFAETMRKEADKQGLSDAAASVNMTSVLAGDGFSVTPDDTQSQPLTVGQPTEFHWTVTATPGAKGPLHADVGADLLGGGSDTLSLGTVQKNAGMQLKMTPRMLGAGILALIVILVLGWLARGRNTPTRSASARRAGRRARGAGAGYARPLDMSTEGDAH